MKKVNLIGWFLITLALITIIIGLINNSKVMDKEKILSVVENYIKNNEIEVKEDKSILQMVRTNDLYRMITKSQEWVISLNYGENIWMYIDVYTGEIKTIFDYGLQSFSTPPTERIRFQQYFSGALILNYLLIVVKVFDIQKNKFNKTIFYSSLIHLIVSLLFFEILSMIYYNIIFLIIIVLYNPKFLVVISLIYGVFGAYRYKKIKVEVPIEDKSSFTILFIDCLKYIRLKVISEKNDVFIVRPKLGWVDIWLWNKRVYVTVEENQAILIGPSVYVNKIKIMLNAFI